MPSERASEQGFSSLFSVHFDDMLEKCLFLRNFLFVSLLIRCGLAMGGWNGV